MNRRIVENILLILYMFCATTHAGETVATGPLAEYVAKPDASYQWVKRREGRVGRTVYAELNLTSQTWRGIVWEHRLFVIRPPHTRSEVGLLFITGGRWADEVEDVGDGSPDEEELSSEVRRSIGMAERLGTPAVILRHVPRQPMFDGKYEDELIALTFQEYLDTHDPEWLLLLPMVKSAVRAMDAASQYARKTWGLPMETYTVTGVSKRGWTTWLLGAIDKRVTAIAPMVIDVLNMEQQMDHQRSAWGDLSYKIDDYTERGLQDRLGAPDGKALLSIVDPYSYRHLLRQPKLIVIGTNDHYWPLDALNLYWNDLIGDKYILYVPNGQHDVVDSPRFMGSLDALHRAANGKPMPEFSWEFVNDDGRLSLYIDTDSSTHEVRAWVASSPNRDFREARWEAFSMHRHDGRSVYELTVPSAGFTAMFGEVEYRTDSLPCYLSTNVRIVGGSGNRWRGSPGT
uniref:PhoPQ-activated pathogenicity-related protein n=1 Tax=Candidatus Kentrum sp. FW TaxID=2126338 RepID=A0A450TZ46_9GAMM|nr:MAG: PhoPQ-activated pathogenicity-related protein [Candidatus Kentron sp. FW]